MNMLFLRFAEKSFAAAVCLATAVVLILPERAGAAAAADRPNIVFILIDDLRWDALGCTGHPFAKTPNIDRLAKEGARCKNFFVSIPLCSPSRGSFLTGQYAHKHGVTNNGDHSAFSHQLVTFPRLLHDAGYETAYVGKWHMGRDDSPRPGFDRWISFKGQGTYEDPVINVDGRASEVTGYMTDILNEHAVTFVKQEHRKPFLLYLAHKAVHGPFTPAERHRGLYVNNTLKPAPSIDDSRAGKPVLSRKVEEPTRQKAGKKGKAKKAPGAGNERGPQNVVRNQLRALAPVDEGVGQILKALEDTKQLERTMIIFTSDNGFFWGEHGLGDKRWAYEESIRDPLLMRYPKLIKAGTTLEQMVLNIDLAPTLLELGGAPIPKPIEGRSLLPLLRDSRTDWRTSFLTEYFQEKQYPRVPTWQAVRTDRWKYVHRPDGPYELYDLKDDPNEKFNLYGQPHCLAIQQELKSRLETLFDKYRELIDENKTEEAAKYKLYGVRLDTSGSIRDISVPPLGDPTLDLGVTPRLVFNVRQALDAAWQDWDIPASWQEAAREYCHSVKIVVSGGFNPDRIRKFEHLGVPVDTYAVGSYLFNNNGSTVTDFTADVVRVKVHGHWVDMAKVGRAPCDNPDLKRVW